MTSDGGWSWSSTDIVWLIDEGRGIAINTNNVEAFLPGNNADTTIMYLRSGVKLTLHMKPEEVIRGLREG